MAILETSIREISHWREHETENGLEYGQSFLTRQEMIKQFPDFDFVPEIKFELNDVSHTAVLENLRKTISFTKVALSETASKKAEGLILRNENRTKIVKLRFEDYERTLK